MEVQFRLPSRVTRIFSETSLSIVWAIGAILTGVVFLYWGTMLAQAALLIALGVALGALSLAPTTVTVGDDGIAIRWLGLEQFIAYDDVRLVEFHIKMATQRNLREAEASRGVRIVTHRSGETYVVCDYATRDELIARANERLARHRQRSAAEAPHLHRGDRSVAAWIDALRASAVGGGYRESGVTPDALWAVVENPKSNPEDRAAAAIVLRERIAGTERARLRVVMESCASPKLRVALKAIDEQDAVKVESSLRRLSAK